MLPTVYVLGRETHAIHKSTVKVMRSTVCNALRPDLATKYPNAVLCLVLKVTIHPEHSPAAPPELSCEP